MAVYNNTNTSSAITSVEFSPVSDGNFAFFYVNPARKDEVRAWLSSPNIDQEIIAETKVGSHWVFITDGARSKEVLMAQMENHGEQLKLHHEVRPVDPWMARGLLSVVGQSLQLSSGRLRSGGFDNATIVFAMSNLAANFINMTFGAQKSEDVNRLHFLKDRFNQVLDEHLPDGKTYSVNADRMALHLDPPHPKNLGEKSWDFLRRYSVQFGEVGLRYFGALALAFPMKKAPWKSGLSMLSKGEVSEAFRTMRNKDRWAFTAGMSYLTGKSIAFFSKVPDPYDNKPHTVLDTLREKYFFRMSSIIEGVAAGALAFNGFAKQKIRLGSKEYPDFLGGIGGLLFAAAFVIRYKAKFGVKELDMDEVYAHATDTLAKVPPEKIPQLMAESASLLKEHMKDEPIEFGQIFTRMMTDTYRYHHIALKNLGTDPDKQWTQAGDGLSGDHQERKLAERFEKPAASHAKAVTAHAEQANTPYIGT